MSENQADNIQTEQEAEEKARTGLPPGLHYDDNAKPIEPPKKVGASLSVIAPIGGQLISSVGGMVGFCPMGGIGGGPSATPTQVVEFGRPYAPTPAQTNYLDCARWQADLTPAIDDVTQTSAWAQAIAVTLPQGRFRIEIINDHRLTPAMLAKYGLINATGGGNPNFNSGCRMTLLHGNAANYPTDQAIAPDFYYCPSVKLLNPSTVVDAIGKKMVMSVPMEIVANAPVFHMPYEDSYLGAYVAHLALVFQGF